MADGGLCDLFASESEFRHASDADDLFSLLETWDDGALCGGSSSAAAAMSPGHRGGGEAPGPAKNTRLREEEGGDGVVAPARKKQKAEAEEAAKVSHITVERNRRKQMNEHLAVLRSLMPCFYVKRGDQASIIGGVVDYIKELQQVLQSLEAKKQRKAYTEQAVLSPRPPPASSPRLPLSPCPPPLGKSPPPPSPRLASIPISPRTPTPGSPYKPRVVPRTYVSPTMTPASELSPAAAAYLPSLDAIAAEFASYAGKPTAAAAAEGGGRLPDVKVEFAGANLVVKTLSQRIPGQAFKIIAALESLSLEILHASISTVEDTMINSFTIKIGIECELSAEELVQEIQQTFS